MVHFYSLSAPAGPFRLAPGQDSTLMTMRAVDAVPLLGEPFAPTSLGLMITGPMAVAVHLAPCSHPHNIRLRSEDEPVWHEIGTRVAALGELPRSSQPAALALADVLTRTDRVGALVSLCDTDPELAGAACFLLTKPEAIGAIPLLREHPAWPALFAGLQSAASGGSRRFELDTRARLAPLIARYGWSVGRHSYGAPDVLDHDQGAALSIGSYCSMNSFTVVLANHASRAVTTYPFKTLANWWPTMRAHPEIEDHVGADVSIGNDVWVGRGVVVLPGTTIGDGAILGANTVARGTIPPYAVVVGNPGQVIKRRFADADIERLLAIRWWD